MVERDTTPDRDTISDRDTTSDQDARMVLRTVYLPPDLDDQLRVRAFRSKQTKNDIIREAVTRWLLADGAGVPAEVSTEPRGRAKSKGKASAADA